MNFQTYSSNNSINFWVNSGLIDLYIIIIKHINRVSLKI